MLCCLQQYFSDSGTAENDVHQTHKIDFSEYNQCVYQTYHGIRYPSMTTMVSGGRPSNAVNLPQCNKIRDWFVEEAIQG